MYNKTIPDQYPNSLNMDTDNESSEDYESFIDLFTLLSFALIIASFIFGIHRVHDSDKTTQFEFDKIKSGVSLPASLPDNAIVLILMNQNKNDILHIVKSGELTFKKYISNKTDLQFTLKSKRDFILGSDDISLVLLKRKTEPNYEFYVYIQEWLTENGINKVKVYFQ